MKVAIGVDFTLLGATVVAATEVGLTDDGAGAGVVTAAGVVTGAGELLAGAGDDTGTTDVVHDCQTLLGELLAPGVLLDGLGAAGLLLTGAGEAELELLLTGTGAGADDHAAQDELEDETATGVLVVVVVVAFAGVVVVVVTLTGVVVADDELLQTPQLDELEETATGVFEVVLVVHDPQLDAGVVVVVTLTGVVVVVLVVALGVLEELVH